MLNQLLWEFLSIYLNLGLAVGLTCGALLLLRPLQKRVLSPRQRLLLWMTAWLSAYVPQWYQILSLLAPCAPGHLPGPDHPQDHGEPLL